MWEDIKQRVRSLKEADEGGADLAPKDYDLIALLADAEALLAVVQALEETNILIANTYTIARVRAAHLALPAHLREQREG